MARVYLGLGSNLGNRRQQVRDAVGALSARGVQIARASSLYETVPMYELDQPRFLNAVVEAQTGLTPEDLLRVAKDVERELGREPRGRNRPREIDVDLLLYDDLHLDTPELTLPHPRMHERPFVLVPLAELRGEASELGHGMQLVDGPAWAAR